MMAARSPISASEEKASLPRRGSAPVANKFAPLKVVPKASTPNAKPIQQRMAHRTQAVHQLHAHSGQQVHSGVGAQQQRVVQPASPQIAHNQDLSAAQQQQPQPQPQPQAVGGGVPQNQAPQHASSQNVSDAPPEPKQFPPGPLYPPPPSVEACKVPPTTGPESEAELASSIVRSAQRGTMYFPPPDAVDADELPYISEDDYDSEAESILSAEDEEIESSRGSVTVRFDNKDVELELIGDTPDPIIAPASFAEAREAYKEHIACGGSLHNRTVTKTLMRTRTGQTMTAQLPPRLAASVMRAEQEEREKSVIEGQLPTPEFIGYPRSVFLPRRVDEENTEADDVPPPPLAAADVAAEKASDNESETTSAPGTPHVPPGVDVPTVISDRSKVQSRCSTGGSELKHITPKDIDSFKTPLFLMGLTKGLAGVGGDEYVYDLGMTQLLEEMGTTAKDDTQIKRSLKVARQGHASVAGSQSFWKAIADVYKRATNSVSGRDGVRAASLVLVLATARAARAISNLVFASMGSIYHMVLVVLSAGKFIVDRVMGLKYRKNEPSTFKELRIAFKQRDFERLGFVFGTIINKFDPTPFNKFKDTVVKYNQMINDRLITKSKSFFLMWVRATICAGAMSIASLLPNIVKKKLVKQLHRWLRWRWFRVCQEHLPPNEDLCNAILREYVCGKRMSRIHKEYTEGNHRLLLLPPPGSATGEAASATHVSHASKSSKKSANKKRKGVKAKSLQVWSRWTDGPSNEPEPMRLYEAMQIQGGNGPAAGASAASMTPPPLTPLSPQGPQPVNARPNVSPVGGAPLTGIGFQNYGHAGGAVTPPPGGYHAQQLSHSHQSQKFWERKPSSQARVAAPAPAPLASSTEPMRLYEALQMHGNAAVGSQQVKSTSQKSSQQPSHPQALQARSQNQQQRGQSAGGQVHLTPSEYAQQMGVKM